MLQLLFVAPLTAPLVCATGIDFVLKRDVGQQVTSTLSVTSEFELVELSATEDGEEVPADMLPEMSRTVTESKELEFKDTVGAMEDGAVSLFERHYSDASVRFEFNMEMNGEGMGMEPVSESHEFESDVVGGKVRFEADGDEWIPSAGEDCEVDEESLASLQADYSFAFLMPGSSLEKGDSWSIDAAHMAYLLDPVGELPNDEVDEEAGSGDHANEEPEFSGEIRATYGGAREVDGRTLQAITLEFDCASEQAFDVDVESFGDDDGEGFAPASLDVQIDEVIDGTGELLFDAELGLVESVNITFSIERTKVENMAFDIPEMGSVEVMQSEVESGTTEIVFQSSLS